MTRLLTDRELNRATLARQHLLVRSNAGALAMIKHLAGLQSQAPLAPYVGLWTRLDGFDADQLAALTADRQVVRLQLMRNTIHLATAEDALGWHHLFAPMRARQFNTAFGTLLAGADPEEVITTARASLATQPMTRTQLGALPSPRFPQAEPQALAYLVTHRLALCQVPPRGVWGHNGPPKWAPLETWLGRRATPAAVQEVVERYLAAFGPATVADIQRWSGLTGLQKALDDCDLLRFDGEHGNEYYDLPDAPRPGADQPAPPRLLPEYDNLLLSHADRSRFITHDRAVPLPPGHGARTGTILLDGTWQGIWQHRPPTLELKTFVSLGRDNRAALLAEGTALASFLTPNQRTELLHREPVEPHPAHNQAVRRPRRTRTGRSRG